MKKITSIIALAILCFSTQVHAAEWIFFYPGEAGSTEEAAPVIKDFFDYLEKKDSKLSFKGKYFNTVDAGLNFIRSKKPAVGILSYAIWEMKGAQFPEAKVIMSTRPLPHGGTTDKYVLVGVESLSDNGQSVFMSEPLAREFVKEKLFTNLPSSLKLTQTGSVLHKIKSIAKGETKGYAILTATEAYTLDKMTSDWTEKIKELAKSSPVPTARVILFDSGYKNVDSLKSVLANMSTDGGAAEILDELRLKGFQ